MLHGRDVVLKEGAWLVANGDDIDIRNTNWLADGGPVILSEQCHVTKVGELIDHTNHRWNLPLIGQLFTLIEDNRVLATPIRWTLGNDEMRWPHSSNGKLSVKSVYHALKNQARAQQNEPSTSSGISSKVWMVIWHTMMPQKIKKIIWKLVHNILPSQENLFKKRITITNECPICRKEVKSGASGRGWCGLG